MNAGDKLRDADDLDGAIAAYAQSRYTAFAAWRIAMCLERLGRWDQARTFYKIYTQNNPLNRMRPSYNDFLRAYANDEKIVLIDLEHAAERAAEHGIPGDDLFFDFCHMNWPGYRKMSEEVVDVLIRETIVEGRSPEPLPRPSTDEIIRARHWEILTDLGGEYPLYRKNQSKARTKGIGA
ncbi:MAG: hypothetical protein M5R36_29095 [Deltaproteobacteria bacterium]|nr:hypothetical protein [Deltaproteobacteria bacterium]